MKLAVILLIFAVAAGMRLYDLDTTPPGLYPDEAVDGNHAVEILTTGNLDLFYTANNGEEGMMAWLEAISVKFFGTTPFALRLVSALAGILTVIGVYLLAQRMFDHWEIAAMASFLMATGFWHVNFSRIGFRAILAPLLAVWMFYYLYKAIESHRLWHWGLAGLFMGLGSYTYIAFRVMPLAVIALLIAYWFAIRAAFDHHRYAFSRQQILGGMTLMIGLAILVALPLLTYFAFNPEQVSVFAGDTPILDILQKKILTIGMFFIEGDHNWRHNIAGAPILYWPVAAFFAVGLLHTLWRFVHSWRSRGHPGLPQTLLLSWLTIGLIPEVLSNEGMPHALRALIVAPAVYILAGMGLHWLSLWARRWYGARDKHLVCLPFERFTGRHCVAEGTLITGIATVALLIAIGVADGGRYFIDWARNPIVPRAFNQQSVDVAYQLNTLPVSRKKYVVLKPEWMTINGIPVAAQTVMFLTGTATPEAQRAKNIYYLTAEQFRRGQYPRGATLFHLQ